MHTARSVFASGHVPGRSTRPRRPAERAGPAVVAVVVACVALLLAGCGSSATSSGSTGTNSAVAALAPGPPEITASTATSPLPAGTPGAGTPPVTIGTKDFPEQFLLGELYTQALRAKGYTVNLQQNLGDSEIIDSAFASNQIQMYPEYLGEIASGLAKGSADTPQSTYQQAQAFEQSSRSASVLAQTPYQNIDVIVVRGDDAQRYGLRTVADLAKISSGGRGVSVAAQPPFRTRTAGLAGMSKVYGLDQLGLLAVAPGETYTALNAGQARAADGFSTDAQLASGTDVALDDPQHIFGFQYVAPVVKQSTIAAGGPGFAATCNWVSSLLTVPAIQAMNRQVQLGGADEATVARDFLTQHGLS